jgi:hypothetical protein
MSLLPKLHQLSGVGCRNLKNTPYVAPLGVDGLHGVPSSRASNRTIRQQIDNYTRFRVFPMHMGRQVVAGIRDKPHAVEGLRSHISTLVARPSAYNSFSAPIGAIT